jgi:translation initiation factor IF-1
MTRKMFVGMALMVVLAIPVVSLAHEGHAHKVMGTVSSVAGNHLMVKTADGKTVMVMLDGKTKITQGKAKLEAAALKVGDRVVAEGAEEKDMIMATTVRLGAPVPAKAAAK